MNRTLVLFFVVVFSWFGGITSGQDFGSLRRKWVCLPTDSLRFDSLSVALSGFEVRDAQGAILPDSLYVLFAARATILFRSSPADSVLLVYRVLPLDFSAPYRLRSTDLLVPSLRVYQPHDFNEVPDSDLFGSGLQRTGSISRAVRLGSSSDASLQSNLNLQLSGRIADSVFLSASISDNSIPLQADGTTASLQDFDRVWINLRSPAFDITAGDFVATGSEGRYLAFSKKVQGISVGTMFRRDSLALFNTSVAGAVSKGLYHRQIFQGAEGNQGPYRLQGAQGESFIVILAGTEKVYMNGRLLSRGEENDYVIDYNTAEITFTARLFVTGDMRFTVEFEYSDKNYTRYLFTASATSVSARGGFFTRLLVESDAKNQPLLFSFDSTDVALLATGGDRANVFSSRFDTVTFRDDQVMYRRVDTFYVSEGQEFMATAYVYNTNPLTARYRPTFVYVGAGRGNYVATDALANGKVYEWVAPVDGLPSGDYEAGALLVPPKRQTLFSAGINRRIGALTEFEVETAFSGNDLNTFSPLNDGDNAGMASHSEFKRHFFAPDSSRHFFAVVRGEFIHRSFRPPERFREVEFNRDWNILTSDSAVNEYSTQLELNRFVRNKSAIALKNDFLFRGSAYSGLRNQASATFSAGKMGIQTNLNLLNTRQSAFSTVFFRQQSSLTYRTKRIVFGLRTDQEMNRWQTGSDSLMDNSFAWFQWELFVDQPDTLQSHLSARWINRTDYQPLDNTLANALQSDQLGIEYTFRKSEKHRIKWIAHARRLRPVSELSQVSAPENHFNSRLDLYSRMLRKSLTTSFLYDAGSGLERKRSYYYVEVPAGQGFFTWVDYNANGVKELNEFEQTRFSDLATYIKVWRPTDEYVKTYTNGFSGNVAFRPALLWTQTKGLKHIARWIGIQSAFRQEQKNTEPVYNPFLIPDTDTIVVSAGTTWRTVVSLSPERTGFSLDLTSYTTRQISYLNYGSDEQHSQLRSLRLNYRPGSGDALLISDQWQTGSRGFESEFLSSRNYLIDLFENELKFSLLTGISNQWEVYYRYGESNNREGSEHLTAHKAGLSGLWFNRKKGILTTLFELSNLKYNGDQDAPLAWQMLDGLVPGNNWIWSFVWHQKLSAVLSLQLFYNGRASSSNPAVHSGGVELRATF